MSHRGVMMGKFSCHIHLSPTIKLVAVPPHHIVTVQPARAGDVCDSCERTALWVVYPDE